MLMKQYLYTWFLVVITWYILYEHVMFEEIHFYLPVLYKTIKYSITFMYIICIFVTE